MGHRRPLPLRTYECSRTPRSAYAIVMLTNLRQAASREALPGELTGR